MYILIKRQFTCYWAEAGFYTLASSDFVSFHHISLLAHCRIKEFHNATPISDTPLDFLHSTVVCCQTTTIFVNTTLLHKLIILRLSAFAQTRDFKHCFFFWIFIIIFSITFYLLLRHNIDLHDATTKLRNTLGFSAIDYYEFPTRQIPVNVQR